MFWNNITDILLIFTERVMMSAFVYASWATWGFISIIYSGWTEDVCVCADVGVSSVVRRRLSCWRLTAAGPMRGHRPPTTLYIWRTMIWSGEVNEPRSEGLSVGSYWPILEVKCRSVGESGEIRRRVCARRPHCRALRPRRARAHPPPATRRWLVVYAHSRALNETTWFE